MAKKSKTDSGDENSDDDAAGSESEPAGKGKGKGKGKAKAPKRLGPRTVAKPCLVGAGLLAVLGAVLPR